MKNILFVDDEPMVLQGLQRQLRHMRNEWNVSFAHGGPEALQFMAANPVDVIVSDMVMPCMDGSQLLNEVSRRHPSTVRIVLSGHAEREAVLRLVGPAHQYLSKPCNADELRNAVGRAFALRDLLGNEKLKKLATRVNCLPALPALYQELTAELQKTEPSIEHIGKIISRDIGMTAKILQLVNSAFFGPAQQVSNTADAVMYLGLITVRSLVLSIQIFSQFEKHGCKLFSFDALSRHSWNTGMAARRIARTERQDARMLDQCFLGGLLHDTGQLILAVGLKEEYASVLQEAKSRNCPLWEVEQEHFGASHGDVGAYLLALWGLPNPIVETVALHHRPGLCFERKFSPVICVHVADVFQHEHAGTQPESSLPALDMEYLAAIKLADRLDDWRAACQNENET
jgi:HD-like signal output (HDOD) protein